jgi:chromosome segregation ATPase
MRFRRAAATPLTESSLHEQLAEARNETISEVRRSAELQRRLDLWMESFVRVERRCYGLELERDHAKACLAQALEDRKDAEVRISVLEGEQRDLTRQRDELSEMADCLRDDLKKAKERKRS